MDGVLQRSRRTAACRHGAGEGGGVRVLQLLRPLIRQLTIREVTASTGSSTTARTGGPSTMAVNMIAAAHAMELPRRIFRRRSLPVESPDELGCVSSSAGTSSAAGTLNADASAILVSREAPP